MAELLRGAELMRKSASESERMDEVNLENVKEWSELVEDARRIAVLLLQDWHRGRRMLLQLVPCVAADRVTSEMTATDSGSQCHALNMEEEMELAMTCRNLDLYADKFDCAEVAFTSSTPDAEEAPTKGPLCSTYSTVATKELSTDHFRFPEAVRNTLPKTCAETDTNNLLCLTEDAQCVTDAGFAEENACLYAGDILSYSKSDRSMDIGVTDNVENVFRAAYRPETCTTASVTDFHENEEDKERVDSHWGAKMQDVNQDPCICSDLGDLPDDLSEYMNDDAHLTINPDVLFGDPWFSGVVEEVVTHLTSEIPSQAEMPSTGIRQQRQKNKQTRQTNTRRKRSRVPRTPQTTDETTPSRPKRKRARGRTKDKEAHTEPTITQDTETGLEPSSADMAGLPTTPTRILHFHPSVQFITIPDTPKYQAVQTLRLSPSVIRLPVPNADATPTYIFVPACSPPSDTPPLPPMDGEVVPVRISSYQQGILSDIASKATSPPWASAISPSNEMSTCKESTLPHSPTVPDIPQVVKEYILRAKAHTCQYLEAGLSLTSHFVNVQVSQRQILHSGKTSNKILGKELVTMGHTDRQNSLLGHNQIFGASSGAKPKQYILLLGNAGMGKTTLVRKLCLDWSRDCLPQFDFVFLLDGKNTTLGEPHYSFQTLLLNLSSFSPTCMDPEAVYTQILAAPKRVLIIFDGFGELRDYESLLQPQEKDFLLSLQKDSKGQTYTMRQLYSAVLQRTLLPGCTLLLATRPRGTASQLLRRTDSLLEVCGFTPTHVEAYLSQYFTDPALRVSSMDYLKTCSYLNLLCQNPGLCRLVCLVLEQSKGSEVLPKTLTMLCYQVLCLKMDEDSRKRLSQADTQLQSSVQSAEETQTQSLGRSPVKSSHRNTLCTRRATRTKYQEEDKENGEEVKSVNKKEDGTKERELMSQLSSLAWEGVKGNSSILPTTLTICAKVKAFGLRTGLFLSHNLRTRQAERQGGKQGEGEETGSGQKGEMKGTRGRRETENSNSSDDLLLMWSNPFLQSFLAGVHLSMSRTVTDRTFLQTLPFQSGPKGRRRPQREELELTQRFAVGILFHNSKLLQRLHSYTETAFRDLVISKQAVVTKHLQSLSYDDLSPAQVLEACHYVYEASSTHSDCVRDRGSTQLVAHLAANLPEVLTFPGVPLNPSDVFVVQNILERAGTKGRSFSLDLEDSGIEIYGLRTLVGLDNINTYRACFADVITLWEQLEQSGEVELLHGAVFKLQIHPLKVTRVCHVEHLAKLVNIHVRRRLLVSSGQSDSILAEGIPAVRELHKLEFELGPEDGPLALTKLWELLPSLHNLQHLDLENSKIGDKGAEKLAHAIASLCFLEILNLSENCIGDKGVKKLATTLISLPKLHCLSLYSNLISDEGAKILAAVLPHVASLADLDVKYNKLTDVGAQSLGASLRNCKKIKSLRMWNQCITYGVFEWLQQQDSRILWQ